MLPSSISNDHFQLLPISARSCCKLLITCCISFWLVLANHFIFNPRSKQQFVENCFVCITTWIGRHSLLGAPKISQLSGSSNRFFLTYCGIFPSSVSKSMSIDPVRDMQTHSPSLTFSFCEATVSNKHRQFIASLTSPWGVSRIAIIEKSTIGFVCLLGNPWCEPQLGVNKNYVWMHCRLYRPNEQKGCPKRSFYCNGSNFNDLPTRKPAVQKTFPWENEDSLRPQFFQRNGSILVCKLFVYVVFGTRQ